MQVSKKQKRKRTHAAFPTQATASPVRDNLWSQTVVGFYTSQILFRFTSLLSHGEERVRTQGMHTPRLCDLHIFAHLVPMFLELCSGRQIQAHRLSLPILLVMFRDLAEKL